jgi:hypothetical protein
MSILALDFTEDRQKLTLDASYNFVTSMAQLSEARIPSNFAQMP